MNARSFFRIFRHDGRAVLTVNPPVSFTSFRSNTGGRPPSTHGITRWLVEIHGRLLLCADQEDPVIRFVADDEQVLPDPVPDAPFQHLRLSGPHLAATASTDEDSSTTGNTE